VLRPSVPSSNSQHRSAKSRVLLAQGGKRRVSIWQYYLPDLADERDRYTVLHLLSALPFSQRTKHSRSRVVAPVYLLAPLQTTLPAWTTVSNR
jgi:hypothetical protein